MTTLSAGLTLFGPGQIVIKLRARVERPDGIFWTVEDTRMGGTDDIPESELLDESLWRMR
jgi:hypothetical protein